MVVNGFWNIYTAFMSDINNIYNKFTVSEAPKHKQNKTGTTDTDYKHIKGKKTGISFRNFSSDFPCLCTGLIKIQSPAS